jgi:hypothetical protein
MAAGKLQFGICVSGDGYKYQHTMYSRTSITICRSCSAVIGSVFKTRGTTVCNVGRGLLSIR